MVPGTATADGSSPRMWGTRKSSRRLRWAGRFIPTHVGNTRRRRSGSCPGSVHPHACGEHLNYKPLRIIFIGSSPRMWGTQRRSGSGRIMARFIPTHVGNTSGLNTCIHVDSVHPHACGEHFNNIFIITARNGSSPRMWGTLNRSTTRNVVNRFIPTHVGNTFFYHIGIIQYSVHPHACGEHTS